MYECKTKDFARSWTFQPKSWHLRLLLWCLPVFLTVPIYYLCLGCQKVLCWCTKHSVLASLWYTVYFLTSWHHFTISSFEHGWNRSIQRKIWWNPVTWILQTGKDIQLLDIAINAVQCGIIQWVFFVPFSSNAEVFCQLSGVQGCAQSL